MGDESEAIVVSEVSDASAVDYDSWSGMDTMESMCMNCGASGQTRLLLHKIPFFRELIIVSFLCPECGERNNDVTFGGEIQVQGVVFTLTIESKADLDRQIIKADSASVSIQELDFEIPAMTQKGGISTIEGVLKTAAKNLALFQAERMEDNPEVGAKVADIISSLTMIAMGFGPYPVHLVLNDPSGNSFIQNLVAPAKDPQMETRNYFRNAEQDKSLGLEAGSGMFKDDNDTNYKSLVEGGGFGALKTSAISEVKQSSAVEMTASTEVQEEDKFHRLGRSEAVSIPSDCPSCFAMGESLTAMTDIPHFKEIIIMCFDCKECGYRNSEVKGGGAIPTLGTETHLLVTSADDMKRDVLKSDTAMIVIPELDLELSHGTLGGLYTTVEGLLNKITKNLVENNFSMGDSATNHHSTDEKVMSAGGKWKAFIARLKEVAEGKVFPFTLQMRDPMGNSFISAPLGSFLPPECDHNLTNFEFERSWQENEDFGMNDINTKDYESGYVEDTGPVLSDRQTRVHVRGPDHPTPFAKGMTDNDNTPNALEGAHQHTAEGSSLPAVEESGEAEYYQPPAGWSVTRADGVDSGISESEVDMSLSPDLPLGVSAMAESEGTNEPFDGSRRMFSDDSAIDFDAREEFAGRREGCVFRLGSKGLGYYADVRKIAS
jgi:zinc finger protein